MAIKNRTDNIKLGSLKNLHLQKKLALVKILLFGLPLSIIFD